MKDIYGAARRVSVWLGIPEGDQFEAAKKLRFWVNGWQKGSGQEDYDEEGSDPETFARTSIMFGELVTLPWFSRVWVIQEVCFGRAVWFHYGQFLITMEYLQRILKAIRYINPQAAYGGSVFQRYAIQVFSTLEELKKTIWQASRSSRYTR